MQVVYLLFCDLQLGEYTRIIFGVLIRYYIVWLNSIILYAGVRLNAFSPFTVPFLSVSSRLHHMCRKDVQKIGISSKK